MVGSVVRRRRDGPAARARGLDLWPDRAPSPAGAWAIAGEWGGAQRLRGAASPPAPTAEAPDACPRARLTPRTAGNQVLCRLIDVIQPRSCPRVEERDLGRGGRNAVRNLERACQAAMKIGVSSLSAGEVMRLASLEVRCPAKTWRAVHCRCPASLSAAHAPTVPRRRTETQRPLGASRSWSSSRSAKAFSCPAGSLPSATACFAADHRRRASHTAPMGRRAHHPFAAAAQSPSGGPASRSEGQLHRGDPVGAVVPSRPRTRTARRELATGACFSLDPTRRLLLRRGCRAWCKATSSSPASAVPRAHRLLPTAPPSSSGPTPRVGRH